MVRFIPIAPEDVPNLREGRRGRVSYPILKSFLESNMPLAQLDRTGMAQGLQALSMTLNQYIRNHDLPIEMFTRSGEIYLARTDVDEDGNIVERETTKGELPKVIVPSEEDLEDLEEVSPEVALKELAEKTR
jgi:antitoxin component of RelBE/YafQ-DinJ toxin-antitoxin module